MFRVSLTAIAAAALVVSGPLAAQDSSKGKQTREQSRQKSKAPDRANSGAVERANENSVLRDGRGNNGQNMQRGGDRQERGRDRQERDGKRDMRDGERSRDRDARAGERTQKQEMREAAREGMEVRDRNGRRVGQVRDVRRAPDGSVIAIVVVLVALVGDNNVITLPAGSFTIINNVVVINNLNLNIGS